ncbi:MAG: hypothetical protein OSB69_22235 [Alphaproteobacteria bacterium]|nr:hypothetical protein [Alphaproteobacteria bacterium]
MAILEDAEIANALGAGARTAGADDVEYREQIDEKTAKSYGKPVSYRELGEPCCDRLSAFTARG